MDENAIGLLIIFGVIFLIGLIIAINQANVKRKKKRKDALDTKISKLPNKDNLKIVFGSTYQYAFVLDNVSKLIY